MLDRWEDDGGTVDRREHIRYLYVDVLCPPRSFPPGFIDHLRHSMAEGKVVVLGRPYHLEFHGFDPRKPSFGELLAERANRLREATERSRRLREDLDFSLVDEAQYIEVGIDWANEDTTKYMTGEKDQ